MRTTTTTTASFAKIIFDKSIIFVQMIIEYSIILQSFIDI